MRLSWFFAYCLYRALLATWRVRIVTHPLVTTLIETNSPYILAHWHCDIQALLHLMLRYKLAAMISRSKDGDIVSYVSTRLGGRTARGSSSRGGASALKEMLRLARAGYSLSMAIDGPRGPARIPKAGVFELAKICHLPIVPLAVIADKTYQLERSWDKSYIPLPFSKITIYFAAPMAAPATLTDADRLRLPAELTTRLDGAKQHVAKIIATNDPEC